MKLQLLLIVIVFLCLISGCSHGYSRENAEAKFRVSPSLRTNYESVTGLERTADFAAYRSFDASHIVMFDSREHPIVVCDESRTSRTTLAWPEQLTVPDHRRQLYVEDIISGEIHERRQPIDIPDDILISSISPGGRFFVGARTASGDFSLQRINGKWKRDKSKDWAGLYRVGDQTPLMVLTPPPGIEVIPSKLFETKSELIAVWHHQFEEERIYWEAYSKASGKRIDHGSISGLEELNAVYVVCIDVDYWTGRFLLYEAHDILAPSFIHIYDPRSGSLTRVGEGKENAYFRPPEEVVHD